MLLSGGTSSDWPSLGPSGILPTGNLNSIAGRARGPTGDRRVVPLVLADGDRGPGGGHGVVAGRAGAVEVTRGVEGRDPGAGVGGARRHVHRQRAVPDALGGVPAEAGDR